MQYLEGRKYVVQGIFLVVCLVFLTRLFFMQLLDGTYKLAADRNTLQRLVQTPYRGLIYDRKNQLLVQNTPVYDLMVVPREVKQLDSARFCALLQIPLESLRASLKAARKYSRIKPTPWATWAPSRRPSSKSRSTPSTSPAKTWVSRASKPFTSPRSWAGAACSTRW
jgi:penicillin-binding protein 2